MYFYWNLLVSALIWSLDIPILIIGWVGVGLLNAGVSLMVLSIWLGDKILPRLRERLTLHPKKGTPLS